MNNTQHIEALEEALDTFLNSLSTSQMTLLIATMLLLTALKGLALWTSAQKSHRVWFIALLFLNTLGILEIVYLLFFGKRGEQDESHV